MDGCTNRHKNSNFQTKRQHHAHCKSITKDLTTEIEKADYGNSKMSIVQLRRLLGRGVAAMFCLQFPLVTIHPKHKNISMSENSKIWININGICHTTVLSPPPIFAGLVRCARCPQWQHCLQLSFKKTASKKTLLHTTFSGACTRKGQTDLPKEPTHPPSTPSFS